MNKSPDFRRKATLIAKLSSLKSTQDMVNFSTINFFLILFLFSLVTACGGKGTNHMTQDELLASIEKGTAPIIVDVRSQSEYESGHVPGALHLPFYALWSRHTEMKAKPEDPVVVYCEHGPRAGIAKFALWTLGYTNLVYLDGHMSGWKEQGLPLDNSEEPHE